MSIRSEITRINNNIAAAYSAMLSPLIKFSVDNVVDKRF